MATRRLKFEVSASLGGQAVRLTATGTFFLIDALDPVIGEQPSKSPVQSARAQHHPATAHALHIFQNRVPMLRLSRQAQQNQQHGFGQGQARHMSSSDMSYNAILRSGSRAVKDLLLVFCW